VAKSNSVRKKQHIPVNHFGDDAGLGISIERISFESLPDLGEWEQPERHDRHSFFLLEKGAVTIEIDFERYHLESPTAIYMHPDQVHRIIGFDNVTVCALAVTNETLKPEYLQLLEEIRPAAPSKLNSTAFELLSQSASLCIQIAQRNSSQLYKPLLKDHGNALIGLFIATYLEQDPSLEKSTRSAMVTKSFRRALSQDFLKLKRPADYAEMLHLSPAYLNECVKNTTGHTVSYHIQHRIILEAKRLLYHSDQSLKEIANLLGYDDYPYFSRLFRKVTGVSPLSFRDKNRD
jgi:AraC family transcriptional activator of pobA